MSRRGRGLGPSFARTDVDDLVVCNDATVRLRPQGNHRIFTRTWSRATQKLIDKECKRVYPLTGGWHEWSRAK
jgi:hypothetical protein